MPVLRMRLPFLPVPGRLPVLGAALLAACEPPPRPLRFSEAMARASAAVPPGGKAGMDGDSGTIQAGPFSEGLAPALRDGKYGYIDTSGREAVTPRFDHAGPFSEGLAPVLLEGRWGYADPAGNLAIPAIYDWAGAFTEGRAAVASEGVYRFIDKAGDSVGASTYSGARGFSGGLAAVRYGQGEEAAWGFIDREGRLAIPPLFADVPRGFSEGYAAVTVGGEGGPRMGYIDTSGGFVMDSLFDAAGDFSDGLAPVARGEASAAGFQGTWRYVDSTGARAIRGNFAWAGPFRGGRALARRPDGAFVLLDRSGAEAETLPDSLVQARRTALGVTYELRNTRWDGGSGDGLARSQIPPNPRANPNSR